MKRFSEVIRMLVISPEIVALLAVIGLFNYFPSVLFWLGTKLSRASDPVKVLSFIPIGILVFIIRGRKDLLFPDHPAGEVLQEWPQYHQILDRYWVSILICGVCGVVSITIWALHLPLSEPKHAAMFLACVIIPMITYLCFHNATIKVRRVLSQYKTKKKGKKEKSWGQR